MSNQFELITTRLISGTGVLRVPDDKKNLRARLLYIDVSREPSQGYLNNEWYPPRSQYGRATFFKGRHVLSDRQIQFPQEVVRDIPDPVGQTLVAVKCMYEGILQTFVNLGLALQLVPISVTNTITDFTNLTETSWDSVVIKCFSDTALYLELWGIEYDFCNPESLDEASSPDPNPAPYIPRGTAAGSGDNPPLSEPYADDSITSPHPLDIPDIGVALPYGDDCTKYLVTVTVSLAAGGSETHADTFYGPIEDIKIEQSSGGSSIRCKCRGYGYQSCGDSEYKVVYGTSNPNYFGTVLNYTISNA